MNAVRLARTLQDAGDHRLACAGGLVAEATDPSTGVVARDGLDGRLAELVLGIETRMAQLEGKLTRSFTSQALGSGALIAVVLFKL